MAKKTPPPVKYTCKEVATKASKELRNPSSTKDEKSVAGSDLTQTAPKQDKKK